MKKRGLHIDDDEVGPSAPPPFKSSKTKDADEDGEPLYVFFWRPGTEPEGWLSNWSKHGFEGEDGAHYFPTAEHYMMYQKAVLMEDQQKAKAILSTSSPRAAKALGRLVKNFNSEVWDEAKEDLMFRALELKVRQNPAIREKLALTVGRTIAEASPYDTTWGIGMRLGDEGVKDPANWRGKNLLGKAWMAVRDALLAGRYDDENQKKVTDFFYS